MSDRSDAFFSFLGRCLDLEARAESAAEAGKSERLTPKALEDLGVALVDLVLQDERPGLGGRSLLTLRKRRTGAPLPWTRLEAGAPALLSTGGPGNPVLRAVVVGRTEQTIEVALASASALEVAPDDEAEGREVTFRLDLAHDAVALERQRKALAEVRTAKRGRLFELRGVLVEGRAPSYRPPEPVTFFDRALNPSQQRAVLHAHAAEDLALLHGPPGTGKTSTLIEIIRQAVRRGERVLATAPSNLAADNLLERLVLAGERVVRIGHPARVSPGLVEHTLDLLVDADEEVRRARKLVKDALALRRRAERWTRAKPEPGEKARLFREAREMIADARRMEDAAMERILDGARVVVSTTSVDGELLGDRRFDLVVVDEACQSTEPGAWVPLLRAGRVVLAGDHRQLPPTIVSPEAKAEGFGVSLFERVAEKFGDTCLRLLDTQYRMHEDIMRFSSDVLYEGQLVADDSVRARVLTDLEGVQATPLTETPLELVDTSGAGFDEELEPDGESRRNPREAELVVRKIDALLEAGVPAEAVAVITPYAAQVRLIRRLLLESGRTGIEVDSVDGFQGREKEVVILSFVRSNGSGDIGFLADIRRTNVAMTRAKRKLLVIGDGATLANDPFYARLIEYFESRSAYHTVWEELA